MHFNYQVCLVKSSFVEFLSFFMRLRQSVVLWQGRGGIQNIALFGKRPYYGKNSSNKQRETTVHHYFKNMKVSQSGKCPRTLKVSSSAVAKNHRNWLSWGPPQERDGPHFKCIILVYPTTGAQYQCFPMHQRPQRINSSVGASSKSKKRQHKVS